MILKTSLLVAAALLAVGAHDPLKDLNIGDALPAADIAMKDVMGGDKSLSALKGESGLLVIFSCNTCPFVIGSEGSTGWENRYPELGNFCRTNKIGFALVNSNSTKREAGDGFADMQAHYKEKNYNCHYLLDNDNIVADAFAARTTPHVFLFDKDLKLVYKGAIDDNVADPKAVTKNYLKDAITAMTSGKSIDPTTTKNLGCSIKRKAVEHTH